MRRVRSLPSALALALATSAACSRAQPSAVAGAGAGALASARDAAPLGYPRGSWRGAPFEDVNRTVLWVSHIVVMHRGSNAADPAFRPLRWRPDPPMPDRTQDEALARAQEVAALAAKDPDRWEELVRTYSDDVVTRDHGGSLGGVRAGQLPADYRDALAVLRPGETSRVIPTALGYAILKRRPLPPAQDVAGRRIVIRYEGTVGGPRGAPSTRSRSDAEALALRIAGEARGGARFEDLVARDSEGIDAAQGGDLGVWPVRDPGFMPREIETLGALRVGETSAPIETISGFEILQRTDAAPRETYAMQAIALYYDPFAPADGARSPASVQRLAGDLSGQLRRGAADFDDLRRRYCCDRPQRWTRGRGPVGLDPVLERLAIGQIADRPVEVPGAFYIPKRLEPASVPEPPPPLYELPIAEARNPSTPPRETAPRPAG
jgi:hypothetical protein